MKASTCLTIALGLLLAAPIRAEAPHAAPPKPVLTPTQIVAAAPDADWVAIAPADLLVMELAPDAKGSAREVVIQLIPPPFSQGWVNNVRKLVAAHWWDGLSINRVQDNYVAQWGDPDSDDKAKAKKLPEGLAVVGKGEYYATCCSALGFYYTTHGLHWPSPVHISDQYAQGATYVNGWPVGISGASDFRWPKRHVWVTADPPPPPAVWPIHCYAMVGVGRDMPPDTGTGAELYAVIGTPPRQLDRNIAIIGRVIAGIENLSSLPRGTGDLGFYKTAAERTPIISVRLASELPPAQAPRFQYLSTESASFAAYAEARANRRDAFYITPAGGVDICNVPVPIRRAP